MTTFETLPLVEPLQRALKEKNYTTPTEIQSQAIPLLLEGKDVLASAQTGTGKTAAFALPILQHIIKNPRPLPRNGTRALVLTPTRELALQVSKAFGTYGMHVRITVGEVYGGVGMRPQIMALKRGLDVLVATPGRLLDLFRQGYINFNTVEMLVLDEADRMLDMGFINDIRSIVAELPENRQTVFFSATFSPQITRLATDILRDPVEVRITPQETTAENVDHRICLVRHENKPMLLGSILASQAQEEGRNLTLIFSRTKFGAERLAKEISNAGIRADSIHGNKSQHARERALDGFRKGRVPVLVATDVAARGIDVKDVTLVINYDLPDEPESYVHRIGRTARGGETGMALSFCSENDFRLLGAIEKLIRKEIPLHDEHPFHCERLEQTRKKRVQGSKGGPRGPMTGGGGKPFRRKQAGGFRRRGSSNSEGRGSRS